MRYERDAITMLVYARNSILRKCNVLKMQQYFEKFSISFRTFDIFLFLASQQSLNCKIRTIFAVSISMKSFAWQRLFLLKCVFNFLYNYLRNIYIQYLLSNERNFVPSPCHTTRSGFLTSKLFCITQKIAKQEWIQPKKFGKMYS